MEEVKPAEVWPLSDYDRHAIWTVLRIAGYTVHVRTQDIWEVRYKDELLLRHRPEVVEAFGVGLIVACRDDPVRGSQKIG